MPLARMMSRSETVQNHAAKNEGLKAFLERKGDEHCFSLLYLIAGICCLIASFGYGNDFCTHAAPVSQMAIHQSGLAAVHNIRTQLEDSAQDTSQPVQSAAPAKQENDGSFSIGSAWGQFQEAIKFPAVKARRGPPSESTGSDVLQAALADLVTGNETKAREDLTHAPKHAFLGPTGLVVLWLKVEGITALGLPVVSILMLSVGLHEVCRAGFDWPRCGALTMSRRRSSQ